jgi:hypothetical protein
MKAKYPIRNKYTIGMRFHNFVIVDSEIAITSKIGKRYTAWKCECDCGVIFTIRTKEIKKGRKSCGCLTRLARYRKLPPDIAMINFKYRHYITSAKKRNLSWELDKKQFTNLIFGNCTYCGVEPSLIVKRLNETISINGVDRVNNEIGYSIDNVVSCCKICNYAKSNLTYNEFKTWIIRLIKYQQNEKNIMFL